MNTRNMARALGWFSIGLGLTELLATKRVADYLGMEDRTGLLRFYALREIASGVAILSRDNPAPGVWSRVGGDAIDLAPIGMAMRQNSDEERNHLMIAAAAVAGITLLDFLSAKSLSGNEEDGFERHTPRRSRETVGLAL
jgi:hypothetical protein